MLSLVAQLSNVSVRKHQTMATADPVQHSVSTEAVCTAVLDSDDDDCEDYPPNSYYHC